MIENVHQKSTNASFWGVEPVVDVITAADCAANCAAGCGAAGAAGWSVVSCSPGWNPLAPAAAPTYVFSNSELERIFF